MNHMPEAVPQQSETSGETPPFFRLRQADAPVVGEALHRIAESGMGDPEAARGLFSLFDAVPDITEDKFHIFSNNNAQTLWDQVSDSIAREKSLSADQKGALTALKYFALESVTETGPATLRDEAQDELQRYGAQLAKTLDPDDPASARFFDTAKVVGKAAGKTAKTVGAVSLILSLLGTRCGEPTISPNPTNPNIPVATETFTPTETSVPTLAPPSGPETTPSFPRSYPGTLTIETAAAGIAAVTDAPSNITELPDVQFIVAKHTQLARNAGLVFDHMAVKFAAAEQRWFLVPVAGDGTIAGWLQIEDPASQTGFRYGEQPTWDSKYSPSKDTYKYGLPALHDAANHFVVGFENGFPLLIEVTQGGAPQYWNDIAEKTMKLVEGAVIIPTWQKALETQDPADRFFKVVDGVPAIDRYDTSETESTVLSPESIRSVATTDGLNPNILTARDADGNTYAFNPDHGWFALPRVEMDYTKLASYTQVEQAFIEDGRANITTALLYAESPTISPDAIDPVYWVSYFNMDKVSYDKIPVLCNNVCGLGVARMNYNEEVSKSYYTAATKPFAWTGFYKVQLESGESIYVISRTLKNPSEVNPNQTINLFYGFDRTIHEYRANTVSGDGRTYLKTFIEGTDKGGYDLAFILPPPVSLDGVDIPFRLSPNDWITGGNPVVSGLQKRGELIAELDPVNLQIMTQVLHWNGDLFNYSYIAPLTRPLPAGFSTHILLAGFMNR